MDEVSRGFSGSGIPVIQGGKFILTGGINETAGERFVGKPGGGERGV